MKTSIYQLNKGINKSIEFKGLKAQYIWWFAALVIGLMLVFSLLYLSGVGTVVCISITAGTGGWGSMQIFRMSKQYGAHGLKKMMAARRLPRQLKVRDRSVFMQLGWKASAVNERRPEL